jgi:CRISPR-associated protein Cas1
MIKRTLYFGNPAHLYMRNGQLCISAARKSETEDESKVITIPIEDIGVVVIDHQQITLTHMLISSLLDNNAAIVTCDNTHHPQGLLLPLSMNSLQTEKFKAQIAASEPLKKQLWAQTVSAKLKNQAAVLQKRGKVDIAKKLNHFAKEVKSGDGDNHEAQGAALYWQNVFDKEMNFRRERFGEPPNNVLNYGYSILRASVARSLVASGALPTLGIFHRNKYNAYCLADDIMEPYRPYIDELVCKILDAKRDYTDLNKEIKQELLQVPALDIVIEGERSPLLVGLQRTTSSLMKCFEGEAKKVLYPELM